MEYVHGVSLEQRLQRFGTLEVKEVLRIGMQAADGLAAAHKQGLVHRDVKPANILLENGVERVKLTDFGLARAIDDASLTQSGTIAGTPLYMAPEQARGETVDHRADLFSLGSVLYALCTGRPPFRAQTTLAVLMRVCEETPRPLQEVNPDVPDWLAEIIEVLHAKDPADRFESAGEVSQLLSWRLAHLQHPGMVPQPPAPAKRGRDAARRRRWIWAGLAVVLGGLFGALLLSLAVGLLGRLGNLRPGGKQPADEVDRGMPPLPVELGPPRRGWRGGIGRFGPRVPDGAFHLDGTANGASITIDGETTEEAVLVYNVTVADGGPVQQFNSLDKVPAKYRDLIPIILGHIARGRPIRSAPP
jgi:hypothetical protein